ncbi:uncharacterized protein C8R40DRAFT_1167701 [Lentinula edodes]|uniref:uncharacterized protein n=1 Tax=Lentinula edodes TaxID=5353 RepID=UPI001E8CCC64|nr:uncharacterized protein C8R40DRAFT_1167701 [Lentinula edodes]KAH7878282.1 hypothetical protein C8R40DRAFT_1167701 [Lentinula edodes]
MSAMDSVRDPASLYRLKEVEYLVFSLEHGEFEHEEEDSAIPSATSFEFILHFPQFQLSPYAYSYSGIETLAAADTRSFGNISRRRNQSIPSQILRFFSPNLSQTDNLFGCQFFAAVRLAVNVESGQDVGRTSAFIQAYPSSLPISRPSLPPKAQAQPVLSTVGSSRTSSDPANFLQSHTMGLRTRLLVFLPESLRPQSPPRHGLFVEPVGNPPPPPLSSKPILLHSHTSHVTSALMEQSLMASKSGMSTTSSHQVALAGNTSTSSSHNPFKTSPFQCISFIGPLRYAGSASVSPIHKLIDLLQLPGPPPELPSEHVLLQTSPSDSN